MSFHRSHIGSPIQQPIETIVRGTRWKILILRSFCTDRYSFERNLIMIRWRMSWYHALKPESRSKPATSCRSSARTIIIGGKRRRITRPVPRGWYLRLNFRNGVSLTWQWKRTSKNKVTFEWIYRGQVCRSRWAHTRSIYLNCCCYYSIEKYSWEKEIR